jgi:hypothetical protein
MHRNERLTETKVAGKNVIVTTAMAFIAEASLLASSPICTCILPSLWAAVLKAYRYKLTKCARKSSYQIDFVLDSSIVRSRPLQQIFEELMLEGQAATHVIPAPTPCLSRS